MSRASGDVLQIGGRIIIGGMARSVARQRDKLGGACRVGAMRARNDVVAPLAREIAALQTELETLSDATGTLARHALDGLTAGRARPPPLRSRPGARRPWCSCTSQDRRYHDHDLAAVAPRRPLYQGRRYSHRTRQGASPGRGAAEASAVGGGGGGTPAVLDASALCRRFALSSRFSAPDRSRDVALLLLPRTRPNDPPRRRETPISLEDALAQWDASSPESQALLPDNLQTGCCPVSSSTHRPRGDARSREKNLRELDVVGLTEQFHESMALLHQVYGWKLLAIPSRRCRTHGVRASSRCLRRS
jgi:hypothetical protein